MGKLIRYCQLFESRKFPDNRTIPPLMPSVSEGVDVEDDLHLLNPPCTLSRLLSPTGEERLPRQP